MEFVLSRSFGLPPEQIIVRGATLDECHGFAQELIVRKVDIAIFDHNLEYEDHGVYLKGFQVAQQSIELGFANCLILHSSDTFANGAVFHNTIEKAAGKVQCKS
jgi:hypothetical protein